MERIEQIRNKLLALKEIDKRHSTFGANRHKFELNKTKSELKIKQYESSNEITLPVEYRNFLKFVGNGGAGPYYGLEKLERGKFSDLDGGISSGCINLSKRFKFTEQWNLNNDDYKDVNGEIRYDLKDKEYFKPDWADGMLRIANFGCGVSINLVVNGSEFGNIWADDRCNEQGILPFQPNNKERVQFLDWYEQWLDDSFEPIIRVKNKLLENSVESVIKDELASNNYNVRSIIYNILKIEPPKIQHNKPEYIVEMESNRKDWIASNNNQKKTEAYTGKKQWWKIWK